MGPATVLKRGGVGLLLVAPAVALAAVAYEPAGAGPEVAEPVDVEVEIGPHTARVQIGVQFGGACLEVSAEDRGATTCTDGGGELGFVFGFGDGVGDAEFAAAAVVPAEAATVTFTPSEEGSVPVEGVLVPLEGRDELLAIAYWSWPTPAPEPPRLEVLDADGSVLLTA